MSICERNSVSRMNVNTFTRKTSCLRFSFLCNSHFYTFMALDKRETVPAASHWNRVGAKPKQHTKVNQQVHSTPNAKLKLHVSAGLARHSNQPCH